MISLKTITIIISLIFLSLNSAPKQYQFAFQSHMIPHPQKAHRGGQDAFYNSSKLLIVADGVGGWNNQGIDPSKYSRFLCSSPETYLKQNRTKYLNNPLQIIKRAQKQNQHIGSATMVVLTITANLLKYCYIGDSGFMVIRRYQKLISIYEYVQQQHSFNYPYQLANQKYGGDNPQNSICGIIQVQKGDIIVVGSDGLYDNIDFHQVLNQVRKADKQGILLTQLAQNLANMAILRGKNNQFNSPFAQRAKLQNLYYMGGKLDDTTVIVAQVRNQIDNVNQL